MLDLEITESMLMKNMEETIDRLQELKNIGITLSIDDFGTGYSSLAYLKRFPLDMLKIDRSFIRNLETDPGNRVIVKTIIDLGHNLNLKLIAEGVENAEQQEALRELKCEYVQGFFFQKPLPAEDFKNYVISLSA